MTALLYAKDLFKSEILKEKINIQFRFDHENPTVEEEILNERLEQVLVRPLTPSDTELFKSLELLPIHIQLFVN
jgi:hypothetical protein